MKIIQKDLTKYSTIRTKSFAKYFCIVNNLNELKAAFNFKLNKNLDYAILGNGSNILFSQEKYDNVLFIKLSGDFDFFKVNKSIAEIGAAYSLKLAGKKLISYGCKDYIFFNLIPASLGGAITQNAGTGVKEEIKDVCLNVKLYDIELGDVITLNNKSFGFDYRNSIIKKKPGRYVVLSAEFDLRNKTLEIEKLIKKMKERISEKINREPSGYSFGSTFMNSKIPAWRCVKAVKDKLDSKEGISYSDKHYNWIINDLGRGKDIVSLIKETQKIVKEDLNLNLKNEVRII